MINPGKYKHRIDIQQLPSTKDAYGQPNTTWANVSGLTSLAASFITTGGRELWAAQKVNALTEGVFELRYVAGITSAMRVKYGSRNFDILYVNNVNEENKVLLLPVKEVI